MSQHFKSAREVEDTREVRYAHERGLSGADQRMSRDAALIGWLAKVYGELHHKSREWPMFDRSRLGDFLFAAGVDPTTATKSHEDAMPIPAEVSTPEFCFEKLRGASFLNVPAESACLVLNQRSQRSLMRS